MTTLNQIKLEDVKQTLIETRGLITMAAKRLGCSRSTIYNYLNEHEELRETLEEARQLQVDMAESKLFDAVDRGEPWAVNTVLKTLGRDRGYGERVEITGAGGGALKVEAALEALDSKSPAEVSRTYEELRRGGKG